MAERVRLALEESEKPGGSSVGRQEIETGDLQLPWRALFCPQDLQ